MGIDQRRRSHLLQSDQQPISLSLQSSLSIYDNSIITFGVRVIVIQFDEHLFEIRIRYLLYCPIEIFLLQDCMNDIHQNIHLGLLWICLYSKIRILNAIDIASPISLASVMIGWRAHDNIFQDKDQLINGQFHSSILEMSQTIYVFTQVYNHNYLTNTYFKYLMINPQQILTSYNTLLSAQSTQVIKHTEQQLKQLYNNPSFLTTNLMILLQQEIPITVKKMSAVHIDQFIKKNKRTNLVEPTIIVKSFLQIISSDKLHHSIRPLLLHSLQDYLSDQINTVFRTALISNLTQGLSTNTISYRQAVYIGQALLGKKANSKDIKVLVNSTFPYFNILAIQLHQQVPKLTDKATLIAILRLIVDYSKLIRSFMARIGLLDLQTSNLLFLPQLEQSITSGIELTLPGNSFGYQLYFWMQGEQQITQLLNQIKSNYISTLAAFLRMINTFVKDKTKLAVNSLYTKCPTILLYCIQATCDLLEKKLYYQLSPKLLSSLFETLGFIISACKINVFYETIRHSCMDLIEKVLLPCLSFSPLDIQEFYQNQTQFVDKTLQIVDKQASPIKKRKEQPQEEIEMFDTLKTIAADCLQILCKYQDQVLSQIFQFTMNVLQGKINCLIGKSVFLLLITLLKPRINNRTEFQTQIASFLLNFLKETPCPRIDPAQQRQQDINYALVLLSVSRYAPDLTDTNTQLLSIAIQRGIMILSEQHQNQVFKILVFEMFDEVNRLENGESYALDILNLYNSLLLKHPSIRLLDSYNQLLQYNLTFFKDHLQPLLSGIFIICQQVEAELRKANPTQLFLNKSLNIVRQIGESSIYLPTVIPDLERALIPLLPLIDGREGIDLQEDILLLLAAFLEHGKTVTLAQQQMFSIIPRIFYHQYHCIFGQAFTTVHSFIYYGAALLSTAPQAIQAIIEMSIASMTLKQSGGKQLSQIDNCEGVIILQSLVLACGSFLTKQIWAVILGQVVNKINTVIKSNKLTANLYALLSLCLVNTQHIFPSQQNQAILTPLLAGLGKCLNVKWAAKALIVGLSQLLLCLNQPFILNNFSSILEWCLALLESTTIKSSVQQAILDSIEDEEQDYENLIELVKNNIKAVDQFTFFKQKFAKLQSTYPELLSSALQNLTPPKRDFLTRILTVEKVANEARTIFKVKKN